MKVCRINRARMAVATDNIHFTEHFFESVFLHLKHAIVHVHVYTED